MTVHVTKIEYLLLMWGLLPFTTFQVIWNAVNYPDHSVSAQAFFKQFTSTQCTFLQMHLFFIFHFHKIFPVLVALELLEKCLFLSCAAEIIR